MVIDPCQLLKIKKEKQKSKVNSDTTLLSYDINWFGLHSIDHSNKTLLADVDVACNCGAPGGT